MFSAIGGLLGKIFGSSAAIEATVSTVSNGIDALVYTDEEKAKAQVKVTDQIIEWMKSTQGQNLARRVIAFSISGVWLGHYCLASLLSMLSVFVNDTGVVTSSKLTAVALIAKNTADEMTPAVMLILTFYFAARHIGPAASAFIERFGKR